ncbi:MAG TPA: LPS-assembly protein LptD, partial [Rhodospirillales bacterium]|nr:LPS-assembly protein LptD [Rhodospirillales bacterium]
EGIPIELTADEVKFDRKKRIVTATGNIVITSENRTLYADSVSFNQNTDVMSARGNVTLVEPGGEVLFGEYMELTSDMKDGFVENLAILLKDRSRLAANDAQRTNATRLEMNKAVYSPCKLCEKDPTKPPLWQLKAVKVVHDKTTKKIKYYDAWLEVAGIPVLYTPYLSHADSTVKRQSGFLAPGFGGSSGLGPVVSLPYFYAIDDQRDFTITPMITYDEGPVLIGEYRQLMTYGELKGRGSITRDSDGDTRGHIGAKGRFNIDDTWRWGFDANRAIGETYMRRYGFAKDNTLPASSNSLTSQLFAEGFRGRNYMAFNSYVFQGIKDGGKSGTIPYVFPMLGYNYVGQPDKLGGRTSLDVDLQALTRTNGVDSRRFSLKGGWQAPFTGPLGDQYTLSASLRGDIYHVNGLVRENTEKKFDGFKGRVLPEIRLDWRYPFVRNEGGTHQIIEPLISAIYSPYGGNLEKIPNEDSLDFEFDDTSLFSSSRYAGIDRVEGGPRFNYGLKWGLYG